MTKSLLRFFLAAFFGMLVRPADAATGAELEVGAAEVDITPPIGFRMAGYFDERISTGIHDPLKAKALVIRQGRTEVALVFCDLVGLSLNVTTNARALAGRETGIPVTNIVISATHSHTGPLFDDVRLFYFHQAALASQGRDVHEPIDYPEFLIEHLTNVIAAAHASLHPAALEVGRTRREGIGFNRRYWMRNGKVVFNPGLLNTNIVRPAGPADPEVGILMAQRPGAHEPFAGATFFAMHSDTVGGTLFSADYEYYIQQTLRSKFGTNFISAFGLGTCGDINHINVAKKERVSGFDVAERIGDSLGEAVLAAVPKLRSIEHPSLAVRSRTIRASLQPVAPAELKAAQEMIPKLGDADVSFFARVAAVKTLDLAQRGSSVPMEVQVFRFDHDTALVCLPGEIFAALGLAIKAQSPFAQTIVMSIANDRPSYVPTEQAFKEGSYEVSNARVQPGTGEALVGTALDLLRELKP